MIAPHLRAMQPYSPIVPFEVLSARLGLPAEKLVKLDANENMHGPSPRAVEAIMHSHALHIYPDPDQTALRAAIADYIGVPAAHILCGAGADEVIDLIGRILLQPGDTLLDLAPTFGMYRWLADICNARYTVVPRGADFSIDVDAIARAVEADPRARLVFVSNPNNPDGSLTPRADLLRLLALPLIVVVDEAYIDFSDAQSMAGLVAAHDNLIVLRTFSKLAGMAGLRVGYGVFPEVMIKHLWKVKQPYTPSVAGTAGAIAALTDRAWLANGVRTIVAERERMRAACAALGWLRSLPSQTNFVLCRIAPDAPWRRAAGASAGAELKERLQTQGILERYFDKDGLRDCVRISVGRAEHIDSLLAALASLKP